MSELQVFKGGWDLDTLDRVVPNQRPADGHLKSDGWEETIILTKDSLGCDVGGLEVGDVIALHTTLTLGYVTGLGFAVESAVDGLKLKAVAVRENTDLSKIKAQKAIYDAENETFNSSEVDFTDEEFGDETAFIGGVTEKLNDLHIANTELIGLKVVELPKDTDIDGLKIISRIQYRQPVRPLAYMKCCGE